jgi:hypothetical protein
LTRAVMNSENWAADGKLNTSHKRRALWSCSRTDQGLWSQAKIQPTAGTRRDKPRFNDPDAGTLKNRAGTRTGGANGIFTVRENGSRAQHQIPKRESLAPGRGVEKSLAPRSGRHVLLREKSRRYLELQNEESDLSDGGNENQQSKIRVGEAGVRTRTELLIQNRDFPDPA